MPSVRTNDETISRRRRGWMAAIIVVGTVVFGLVVNRHQSIASWLLPRYLSAGALTGVFALSCLVAGHWVVLRTLKRVLPLEEHVAVAFPLGVLLFSLVSFLFGIIGLYGLPFFILGPSLLIAIGARASFRTAARWRRHLARRQLRLVLSPLRCAALAFGLLGVLLVWFPILAPQNASYDARWRHLPIAEHYVAQGGIAPFTEGWVEGAQPQLASHLYAWAFSMPGAVFDRVVTAANMEFALFLVTLVGVAAIVRRVLRERAGLSWAALFLFPGIFCYDSGLVLGADHVAAVFAPAIFLLALRFWDRPTRRLALLLGAVVAGALDTKYTAAILVPLPFAVVVATAVRHRAWGSALSVLGAIVVFTAPHWLKNAVYYGDPLFPLLRRVLPDHPWSDAAEAPYALRFALRRQPFGLAGVVEMLRTLATFSFVPHDFPVYHRDLPVFGSLFTLTTPLLVFFRARRRLLWLFAGAYLGMAAWFWIHQFDRYLQVLVPWMAAATAVVLILVWRAGWLSRLAVGTLVALQVAWGARVPFIPTHRASGFAIQKVVVDLLGRDYTNESGEPLVAYPEWEKIGRALPRGAKVLIHEEQIHLGISAASALDSPGEQGAFYWGEPGASSPAEVWKLLRAHGITHVVWAAHLDHGSDTVAGGLVFFDFAEHYTKPIGTFGGFALSALPDGPPPDTPPNDVAYYPCDEDAPLSPGLYPLEALARSKGDPRPVESRAISGVTRQQALERARFLVFDASCNGPLPPETRSRFELLAARGHAMLMVRKPL